jgi:hypothetical protein
MALIAMVKFKTQPIFSTKKILVGGGYSIWLTHTTKNVFRESNSRLASTEFLLILRISKAYHLVHQIYVAVFHLIGGPQSTYRGHSATVLV